MINDGLFEKFKMDSVWGMHNWPGLEVGRAVAHTGAAMAGADIFILTIDGKVVMQLCPSNQKILWSRRA